MLSTSSPLVMTISAPDFTAISAAASLGVNNSGWWGEGEIKFYMDEDTDYLTIWGTGTEDYFCGSYDFEDPVTHDRYVPFTTPYSGFQVLTLDILYRSQFRFGMYRWHITE